MYKNKTHKINFALDDNDVVILMNLRKKYNCTTAQLFRYLLHVDSAEVVLQLMELQKEIHQVKQDLIKLVRS